MKLLVICVGHRMPDWVDAGVQEFARRMPRDSAMQIVEGKAEPRTQGKPVEVLIARLRRWRAEGDDVALLIGGPDGLSPALKSRAHELIRLSSLTLPHALARLLLAEALYRAVSLEANHPYHRE